MNNQIHTYLQYSLICSIILLTNTVVEAQITPDGTLGAESSRVTPNVLINGASADRIDRGAQRGANLFHSFREFNINNGQKVYFVNPTGIQNIFTRVTGNSGSNIFGTLGVEGSANLFLLNPNGIVFGQNSRLDVNGSFVGTTANAIRFGSQGLFSVTNPDSPPLLTINPSALLFNQINGTIVSKSTVPVGKSPAGINLIGLRVPDGQSLLLVGGDVQVDGGNLSAGLTALGGRIELGGLASTGAIAFNNFRLTYPDDVKRSNVSLINDARVSVLGNGGGNIVVNANALSATNGGRLIAGSEGVGNAGDIVVNASTVNLVGVGADDGIASGLYNQVLDNGIGNGGNITVNTNSFNASSGAVISASTFGRGNSGNIFIDASDRVSLKDSFISSSTLQNSVGRGGKIQIRTEAISLTGDAFLSSSTNGQGDAGSILIDTGSLSMSDVGSRGLFSVAILTSTGRLGNAGNITIHARDTILLDQGSIFSNVLDSSSEGFAGIGRGGDINITTRSLQMTNDARLSTSSYGLGDAGNIQITTKSFLLTNGGTISSTTGGLGNAGKIEIQATDQVVLDGGSNNRFTEIASAVLPDGKGLGGDIQITSGSLSITNNAVLLAGTGEGGKGDSGNVTLNARDRISFSNGGRLFTSTSGLGNAGKITIRTSDFSIDGMNQGSGIFSNVFQTGIGRAGNIDIAANSVSLINGGNISAATSGQGRAGDITINARDRVSLSGTSLNGNLRSALITETTNTSSSDAGNITLDTKQLNISSGAIISAATYGQGRSGNITINASNSISLFGLSPDSRFRSAITTETANNSTGDAGYLTITTKKLNIRSGAGIFAATFGKGTAGDIKVLAHSLLVERGFISAFGNSTSGGNITLQLKDALVLRQGSQISTNAGTIQAGGNGGNIIINAGMIVAPSAENSDISANAYSGNGGNVRINTKGIFGIQERAQLTPQSDITASSQFGVQGQITINQPDVQPTQGLIELPNQVLDASNQIGQVCPKGVAARRLGEFIITGRGSLPPSPLEPLAITSNISPLATLEDDSLASLSSKQTNAQQINFSAPVIPNQIIEATGWVKKADGSIELVAQVPEATPHVATTAAACATSR